jgi:hypothetical protein
LVVLWCFFFYRGKVFSGDDAPETAVPVGGGGGGGGLEGPGVPPPPSASLPLPSLAVALGAVPAPLPDSSDGEPSRPPLVHHFGPQPQRQQSLPSFGALPPMYVNQRQPVPPRR